MKFSEFPQIETERLMLRQMTFDDAPSLFRILSDPDVTRDMGVEAFVDVEQAAAVITFMNDLFSKNRAFRLGIVSKDDGVLMGTCGYNEWETERGSRGEIAYDLGSRIGAFTNLDATPSISLLCKLGFTEEGVLRGYAHFHGEFVDQRCFALLKTDLSLA